MRIMVAAFLVAVIVSGLSVAQAEPKRGDKTDVIRVEFILPRFKEDRNDFKDHPGLKEALEGVPGVVKAEDALFSFSFHTTKNEIMSGFTTRIAFDPAKGDVGDFAKAVAGVKVPEGMKQRPAAILVTFPASREKITDAQRNSVWKALKGVKGVNLQESSKLIQPSAFGIVLDGEGGARYRDIAAAFKAAGLPLQTR